MHSSKGNRERLIYERGIQAQVEEKFAMASETVIA